MSRNEFLALCTEYTIEPAIALECEAVEWALMWAKKATNNITATAIVRAALEENF